MWKRRALITSLCMTLVVGLVAAAVPTAHAAVGFSLYTPFSGISATPGETIDYAVEVLNDTDAIRTVEFKMQKLPDGWTSHLTSGGRDVQQLSIKPGDAQEISLEVQVPLEVEKDVYTFELTAQGSGVNSTLPLTVTVTEEGTAATELSVEQPNLQGDAASTFDYKVTLRNRTADEQNYALTADTPRGWSVTFKADGNDVTSVTVEPNSTKDVDVSVSPPENVKAGEYAIPIKAATSATSADAELEAVITGTHELDLSTPSERLNTDVTAGGSRTMELVVTNTGTAPVSDIELSAEAPTNWEISFNHEKINALEPGQSQTVKATIAAADEAIAGDYVVTMKAESPDASANADIRVSVKTSWLWGIVGILIIAGVLGGVYYLIRTYGRR